MRLTAFALCAALAVSVDARHLLQGEDPGYTTDTAVQNAVALQIGCENNPSLPGCNVGLAGDAIRPTGVEGAPLPQSSIEEANRVVPVANPFAGLSPAANKETDKVEEAQLGDGTMPIATEDAVDEATDAPAPVGGLAALFGGGAPPQEADAGEAADAEGEEAEKEEAPAMPAF